MIAHQWHRLLRVFEVSDKRFDVLPELLCHQLAFFSVDRSSTDHNLAHISPTMTSYAKYGIAIMSFNT